MNYHLLFGINKYLCWKSRNKICDLDIFYCNFKETYMYKIPTIRIKSNNVITKMSNKYKYIVTDINSEQELKRILNYDIYVFGIFLMCIVLIMICLIC